MISIIIIIIIIIIVSLSLSLSLIIIISNIIHIIIVIIIIIISSSSSSIRLPAARRPRRRLRGGLQARHARLRLPGEGRRERHDKDQPFGPGRQHRRPRRGRGHSELHKSGHMTTGHWLLL